MNELIGKRAILYNQVGVRVIGPGESYMDSDTGKEEQFWVVETVWGFRKEVPQSQIEQGVTVWETRLQDAKSQTDKQH